MKIDDSNILRKEEISGGACVLLPGDGTNIALRSYLAKEAFRLKRVLGLTNARLH